MKKFIYNLQKYIKNYILFLHEMLKNMYTSCFLSSFIKLLLHWYLKIYLTKTNFSVVKGVNIGAYYIYQTTSITD